VRFVGRPGPWPLENGRGAKSAHTHARALLRRRTARAEEEEAEEQGEEEEEGDENAPAEGYRVLVTISDGAKGRVMQVGGLATDHFKIHRVAMYEAGKQPSSDAVFSGTDEIPAYAGPAFEELDEALQVRETGEGDVSTATLTRTSAPAERAPSH